MKYSLIVLFGSLSVIGVAAQPSFACDGLTLNIAQTGPRIYDPSLFAPTVAELELSVVGGPAASTCRFETVSILSMTTSDPLMLNRSNGGSITGALSNDALNILERRGRELHLTPAAVSTLVTTGRIGLNYLRLEPGNFVQAGLYTNQVELRVGGIPQLQIQTELSVEPAMRLVGAGDPTRKSLDLGTLRSNAEARTSFIYQANTALLVSVASETGGTLDHELGPEYGSVPYQTYLDGQAITPTGLGSVLINSDASGQQRISNILVRVGETGPQLAGDYRDVLTLSFSAS